MVQQQRGRVGVRIDIAEGPGGMSLDQWADQYVRLVLELDRDAQLAEDEELDPAA